MTQRAKGSEFPEALHRLPGAVKLLLMCYGKIPRNAKENGFETYLSRG